MEGAEQAGVTQSHEVSAVSSEAARGPSGVLSLAILQQLCRDERKSTSAMPPSHETVGLVEQNQARVECFIF